MNWRSWFRVAKTEAAYRVKDLTSNTSSAYMYSCASREKRLAVKILKSRRSNADSWSILKGTMRGEEKVEKDYKLFWERLERKERIKEKASFEMPMMKFCQEQLMINYVKDFGEIESDQSKYSWVIKRRYSQQQKRGCGAMHLTEIGL